MLTFKKVLSWLRAHFPAVIFHLMFVMLVVANFRSNLMFVGWDAINPELNLWVNFQRSIFASWQENYGVGTLTGHAFAALLPHTLAIALLRVALPLEAVRTAFTLLCWYLGGWGMFVLTWRVVRSLAIHEKSLREELAYHSGMIALIASVFYVFNLATTQIFYIQLEAFIVFFAGLPWLFLTMIRFLEKPSFGRALMFFVVNILASVQGFIPPLFVAYSLATSVFLAIYWANHQHKWAAFKQAVAIILLIATAHAYWFTTFAYYTVQKTGGYLSSYNNLLSTPDFVAKNLKYGDLANVVFLKSFFLEGQQAGAAVFSPWLKHLQDPLFNIASLVVFLLAVAGFIAATKKFENTVATGIAGVGLAFFTILATNTPPFSLVSLVLRTVSSAYEQAFRIAFTKVGLGVGFSYSLLAAIGLCGLLSFFWYHLKSRSFNSIFLVVIFGLTLFIGWPHFLGQSLYKNLLLEVPQPYRQVMEFFKTQPNARIADLPQDCAEGWFAYNWGYYGSGFYWYGLKQPVMARTFDVWNHSNENYYWEVSQALREQDFERLATIFRKYDVRWVVYDPNQIHCKSEQGFSNLAELPDFFAESDEYTSVAEFDDDQIEPLRIYELKTQPSNQYVMATDELPQIGPTTDWRDHDVAFEKYGFYLNDPSTEYDVYYPFRSLFSKRGTEAANWEVFETNQNLRFSTTLPADFSGYRLQTPSLLQTQELVPIELTLTSVAPGRFDLEADILGPEIMFEGRLLSEPQTLTLGSLTAPTATQASDLSIFVNNLQVDSLPAAFSTENTNKVVVLDSQENIIFEWSSLGSLELQELLRQNTDVIIPDGFDSNTDLTVIYPKIATDQRYFFSTNQDFVPYTPFNCNQKSTANNEYEIAALQNQESYMRLQTTNNSQCLPIPLLSLTRDQSYLVKLRSRTQNTQQLRFSVTDNTGVRYLEVPVETSAAFEDSYLVLPPSFAHSHPYTALIENLSVSEQTGIADIQDVTLWPMPYRFLSQMELTKPDSTALSTAAASHEVTVSHPNEVFYSVELPAAENTTEPSHILLAQAYDEGWIAVADQKLSSLLPHTMYNNWGNAWSLPTGTRQVRLFYWPQLITYTGQILTLATGVFLVGKWSISRWRRSR